jgi:DedD protein
MDHLIDDDDLPRHERELTLSTGAILGIFLGLVVLCGGFFGFGYNMGRKSAPTPLSLSDVSPEASAPATVAKPSAGSSDDEVAVTPVPKPSPKLTRHTAPVAASDADTSLTASDAAPATTPKPKPSPERAAIPTPPAPIVREPTPVAPAALNPSTGAPTASYMVQVAAVSHKEDADLLLGALRARGYAVSARPVSGDSFIHVQVGPFHDKKEADAMRQRLLTDGYNAIVKQ